MYVRRVSGEEEKELRRMTRREIGRVSQRAQMILLSAQGRRSVEVASVMLTSDVTVRFWIGRFNAQGTPGLYDRPKSGRPHKFKDVVAQAAVQLLQADPKQHGFAATFWTVAMLSLALGKQVGIWLSGSCLRHCLHELGLRWSRPRLGMPMRKDPQKTLKQWQIAQAVVEAGPQAAVLYADETRLALLPLVRCMWQWLGSQVRVPTPGSNVSRAIFGALEVHSGRWEYLVRERLFKEDFIAFLEHLLCVYPTVPIILVVDNFSSHTAKAVQAWLAEHSRVQLFYLPKYCSHLNPVEAIWRQLKGTIAANRLYASMQLLLETVHCYFAELTPAAALRLAA